MSAGSARRGGAARDGRESELRALVGADHPHLVPVVDVGQQGGMPFVAVEAVPGRTLAECFPLSSDEAALVARSVAAALASLHAEAVVHGAVDAGNVLVAEDGTVLLGPPDVRPAPEARAGHPADDVLALGRLLQQSLAGSGPAAPSDLPWPGLVASLTAPQRADRPTAALLLRRLDGQEPHGVPSPRAGRPQRGAAAAVPVSRVALRQRLASPPVLGALLLAVPLLAAVLLVPRLVDGAGDVLDGGPGAPGAVPSAAEQPTAPPAAGGEPQQPAADPPAPGPVPVAGVQLFAPGGSQADYPDDVALAADGDPSTAWTSQRYGSPAFGNLRPGVGLLYDLGEPTDVAELRLTLPFPGASLRVHAGDEASAALLDSPPRATVGDAPAQTVAPFDPGAPARWWVVWFDRLPTSGELRAGVAETTFLRR